MPHRQQVVTVFAAARECRCAARYGYVRVAIVMSPAKKLIAEEVPVAAHECGEAPESTL